VAAAAGGIISMVVRKSFCSFFFACGRHLVIGEVTPHNFLPRSSHDFVVIPNSYVHKATKKVGYKI
jgi:hypothetical protein